MREISAIEAWKQKYPESIVLASSVDAAGLPNIRLEYVYFIYSTDGGNLDREDSL